MLFTTENVFDRLAKNYWKTEEKRFEPANNKTLQSTVKYLHINDHVLDYGCATGTKAAKLAIHVKKITAIDISSKMIGIAQALLAESKIRNIDFIKTGIFDDQLKAGTYDVVLAFNILHLLENTPDVMKRIYNLLKPGGVLISNTTCLGEKIEFVTRMQFYSFLMAGKAGLFPGIKRFKFKELENLITEGGFRIIETERYFYQMSFEFVAAKKQ